LHRHGEAALADEATASGIIVAEPTLAPATAIVRTPSKTKRLRRW
jgi:hypothetical protein